MNQDKLNSIWNDIYVYANNGDVTNIFTSTDEDTDRIFYPYLAADKELRKVYERTKKNGVPSEWREVTYEHPSDIKP